MRLELGKRVRCKDDAVRELADIVIDSGSRSVTHLVVQHHGDPDGGRCVPIELANQAGGGTEVSLRCTAEALEKFERVRMHAYLGAGERIDSDPIWDTYDSAAYFAEYVPDPSEDATVSYDVVPRGEVELRHASGTYSAEGHHLGSVDGVVIDDERRISRLLLARRQLWWRREVSIPAEAIAELSTTMVTLGVTRDQVGAFPAEHRA